MTRTTPELASPSKLPHQWEGVWPSKYDLAFNRPKYTVDHQLNQVSNLEPSSPEAETLPLRRPNPVPVEVFPFACGLV
ncbi:hypothetical protein AVEN_153549-1 [Araneus ventricosus]|uniref:Uncharacterized protein n=1 Tax=Araneus ventricosus TaxID=182803 RepID=A0A4Y2GAP5_ARAVE|nr:hypothetical protein AVEN_153549-1 [Araneus ventricosus]